MGLQEKTKAKVVAEITDENHPITADDIEELKKLENIKDINRMAKAQGYPDGFRLYTGSDDPSKENNQVQFVAYDDLESDGPFSDGQLRMMEGEYPSAQNQVVINQKLADMNQDVYKRQPSALPADDTGKIQTNKTDVYRLGGDCDRGYEV